MADAAPPYRMILALAAVLVGIGLFCGAIVAGGFGAGGATDPRLAWILTPLFFTPLAIHLMRAGRLRVGGLVLLVLILTVAHFVAIFAASTIYKPPVSSEIAQLWSAIYDSPAKKAARAAAEAAKHALGLRTALNAGGVAGALGALLALAPLLFFGRAFRSPRALGVMALAVVVLTGLGVFGLAGVLPSDKTPVEFAWRVFAPWQAAFGAVLVLLFAAHDARRPPARQP